MQFALHAGVGVLAGDAHQAAVAAAQNAVDAGGIGGETVGLRPSVDALAQGGGVQVALLIGVGIGGKPEVVVGIGIEAGQLVDHGGAGAGAHVAGKLQGIVAVHAHAAVAADAGHAGGGIGAVDAQA